MNRIYLRPSRVINFFSFVWGAMTSSAVSSVMYLRDAAGNNAETRTGAYIYYGDAASFHEWECRTPLCMAGKIGDPKVCDGLRGDAFVAAQEVDGRARGIDTLIQHVRGMVFPSQKTNPKNYSVSTAVLEDPCPDIMERA